MDLSSISAAGFAATASALDRLLVYTGLAIHWLALLFVWVVGVVALVAVVMALADRLQTADAVRRNYPLIGRFRRLFSILGEFFRQYFFAMDREEPPFNRAQRNWAERAAQGKANTSAFGSTTSMTRPGQPIFLNAPYGLPEGGQCATIPMRIGPDRAQPYDAPSFFNISGMSFGAISRPAVKALSRGAAEAGVWLNTGEGGLSDWHLEGGCDLVLQIGTAKYGVRDAAGRLDEARLRAVAAHPSVRMIEVKLSQWAKPGRGGILPGGKVTAKIAEIRGIPPGVDSISPDRHAEIGDDDALLDFLCRVRAITGKPAGFKTVMGEPRWFDGLCGRIAARGLADAPDFVAIDGGEGGTGAAPMALMDHVGLSIREALPMAVAALDRHGLRGRVRVVASGKLINPVDVAWALAAGADFVTSARGFMVALGCIQALKCNRNTCPTGITTHDPALRRGLVPKVKAKRVAHYARGVIREVETIAQSCGVREPRGLGPRNMRIIGDGGRSIPFDDVASGSLVLGASGVIGVKVVTP
jgi:glutamate synthase domain-containing protein 2